MSAWSGPHFRVRIPGSAQAPPSTRQSGGEPSKLAADDGNATQPESIATPKSPDAAVMKLWFALPSRSARPSVSVP